MKLYFLLNEREVCTSQSSGFSVLDYLRNIEGLTATKQGCREGGCGACLVLLGELNGEQVRYKAVTSCLLPIGELQGKHLVTVEGLNMEELSSVQQAILDYGASQCGFCTPGMVVSMTGYLMETGREISEEGIKNAISGNLCRCTGYASLKRAGSYLVQSLGKSSETNNQDLVASGIIPDYFRDVSARLRQLPQPVPENSQATPDFLIAGGTDIYLQNGDLIPETQVKLLNFYPQMKGITRKNQQLHIGALTTFEDLANDPEMIKILPDIKTYMHKIASLPIRNRATVGGNIIVSGIGDVTLWFLALESLLVLQHEGKSRTVPIKEFFQGYKEVGKTPEEILTEIIVTLPHPDTKFNFEKVAKRQCLDVASVNSAIKVRCEADVIGEIGIAMAGVAPMPLFLTETSSYFKGKRVEKDVIQKAFPILQGEISPISDIRGSAEYKRLLARQLLIAHFIKLFPEKVNVNDPRFLTGGFQLLEVL